MKKNTTAGVSDTRNLRRLPKTGCKVTNLSGVGLLSRYRTQSLQGQPFQFLERL